MPCDSIQTNKVEFLAASTDAELLGIAIRKMRGTVIHVGNTVDFYDSRGRECSFNRQTGALTVPEGFDTNRLKRGYSEAVVESQAAAMGWEVSWTENENGNREATVERRV